MTTPAVVPPLPLHDSVTVAEVGPGGAPVNAVTVPAYFGAPSVAMLREDFATYSITSIVALVPPGTAYDYRTHAVWHRGTRYEPDGAHMVRYFLGHAHHVTIPLRHVDNQ